MELSFVSSRIMGSGILGSPGPGLVSMSPEMMISLIWNSDFPRAFSFLYIGGEKLVSGLLFFGVFLFLGRLSVGSALFELLFAF